MDCPQYHPFSLEEAKEGHALITRGGINAFFVAYVPEFKKEKVLVRYANEDATYKYYENGRYLLEGLSEQDLFLAPSDFKVDDVMVVSSFENGPISFRYFSHIGEKGKVRCFCDGASSVTSIGDTSAWICARRATPEEIAVRTHSNSRLKGN